MYLRHNFSKAALEDQLKLVKILVPSLGQALFDSPYKFLKKYDAIKNGINKLLMCEVCSVQLLCDSKTGNPLKEQPCGHKFLKQKACYSIFLPIEPQLTYYIENHHLRDLPTPVPEDELGDVTSGAAYKWYVDNGIADRENTVTLQLNIDAAQVHKNSAFNFTPCMGVPNEAKYKIRRSNIILFGLYYGNKKPTQELFLEPLVEMLRNLYTEGIIVNGKRWFVRLLIITVDTIERCILRCTCQFNGLYGCDFCLIPGNNNPLSH